VSTSRFHRSQGILSRVVSRVQSCEAAQIIEFAVTLPLLMVFVVGIGDFGSAITLKQKLNNAVREGARFGANEPTADLYSTLAANTAPASVNAIARLVGSYLQSARLNDCGLATGAWTISPPTAPLGWTYTGSTCALTLSIDRGYAVPAGNANGTTKWMISTRVSISYPYTWQFNRVIGLIAPGANYAGPSLLTSDATIPNFM
jgi:Flp pilus assembly protein TadG